MQNPFRKIISWIRKQPPVVGHETWYAEKPWLKFYDPGKSADLELTDLTLVEMLNRSVSAAPESTFLRYAGRTMSFHEFYKLVQKAAGGLQSVGVQPGDRVALLLPNTPQFLIGYWAALYIGAVAVPINPFLSPREIDNCIQLSGAQTFLVLDRLLDRVSRGIAFSRLNRIVVTSLDLFRPPLQKLVLRLQTAFKKQIELETHSFTTLLKHAPAEPESRLASDAAVMLFTGGVTGEPKGVIYSHTNLLANAAQSYQWIADTHRNHDVVMGVLPFFHSYGMSSCHHLAIMSRAELILEPRFNPGRILSLLRRHNVTYFPGVPTMFKAIIQKLKNKPVELPALRVCISGGAPLPVHVKDDFEELTHGKLVEGYGLTEAAPITHCNPINGVNKPGSIGIPLPGTEARLIDTDSGRVASPTTVGELQVRGPQVMLGYWQAPHATALVLNDEGWLSTGDMAAVDEDGYFYIVDRRKEIIFNGGFNVYPSEVEQILTQHSAVDEACVIGVPDELYGQLVKGVVVLREGHQVSEPELRAFCKDKLASYKIPRKIVFVESLPKNFLGKVLRRQLSSA